MSEAMNGTFSQQGLAPSEPPQRVERLLDREAPDRDPRREKSYGQEPARAHGAPPEEDRAEISEEALRALREAGQAKAPPA